MSEINVKFTLCVSKDKSIELTEDEAKDLYYKLHELFGVKHTWTWPVVDPCPRPIQPYYTSPSVAPNPIVYPYITCETNMTVL